MLFQIVLLFGAAVLVAWLFRVIRAPAIIGFLFAGILIGPSGLRLIQQDAVSQFADLGLVLLLFAVGLELSPGPLLRTGRRIIIAAGLQIGFTVVCGVLGIRLAMEITWPAAVAMALAITPSSTAIVLKQLADIRKTDSPVGTTVTGVSLVQDIMVISLMLFLPLLAGPGETGLARALGKGIGSLALLCVVALVVRWILPKITTSLVRLGGQELMALFAVLMACAGAWIASVAGWSPALGACVAGLLLAETDIRHQLFADIVPFRDVFNALFFISMGMLVDMGEVLEQPVWIAIAVFAVLSMKTLLAGLAVLMAGWPLRLSVQVGMGLATISEFGFVLAREADRQGIFPSDAMDTLTAVIVGTMIFGALLVPISERVAMALHTLIARGPDRSTQPSTDDEVLTGVQVVIVGYGLNGQNLGRVLRATNIPFSIIEMNPALVATAREAGERVIVGDATRLSILQRAGLDCARAIVVAINDQEATRRIIAQARAARPDIYILARTRYTSELEVLYRLGAQQVIPEEFETSIEIFAHVLKHFGIPENVVEAQITMIRAGNYGMLRGRPATHADRVDLMSLLEATTTQTFMLADGSPACGRTIREVDLRAKTGVTIIAIVRGGKATTNPLPDHRFEHGDVLVLLGGHKQLDEAKTVLSPAD